jgi:hypothetical protein
LKLPLLLHSRYNCSTNRQTAEPTQIAAASLKEVASAAAATMEQLAAFLNMDQ